MMLVFWQNSLLPLMAVVVTVLVPLAAVAVTFDVSPSGDDMGLSEALELAEPGDTIFLADGTYDTAIVSYRDGEDGQPITVEGGPDAVINGNYKSRSVLINHSFISLRGFSVDGKVGGGSDSEDYIKKCVFVDGEDSELDGFVMEGLFVKTCGDECVRLKNSVVNAKILENTIEGCGINVIDFGEEHKNGEGIYIGTSSIQWVDDETPDNCVDNLIEGNVITNGIECVDIKEGSTGNIVQGNFCSNQIDEVSGCFNIRGDDNIIRNNIASNCMGAAVRIGGSEIGGHSHGQGNNVYDNEFIDCGEGSVKVLIESQGLICGNMCDEGNCDPFGTALGDIQATWDQACNNSSGGNDDDGNVDDNVDGGYDDGSSVDDDGGNEGVGDDDDDDDEDDDNDDGNDDGYEDDSVDDGDDGYDDDDEDDGNEGVEDDDDDDDDDDGYDDGNNGGYEDDDSVDDGDDGYDDDEDYGNDDGYDYYGSEDDDDDDYGNDGSDDGTGRLLRARGHKVLLRDDENRNDSV